MKRALKTTFLYIGTAIGAGFSSGREIALFFGDMSPFNVALSSVFMSLLCALFLIAGKRGLIPKTTLVRSGIFLSAAISLCAMLAGSEYVLHSLSNVPMLGLVMAIIAAIVVVLGIEKIKLANAVFVPLIILSIIVIFSKLGTQDYNAAFIISKPILYSGLDVLLGGVIISEEGKKMSYKQIAATCTLLCVFLFVILFMLQTIVLADKNDSSMPVLAVADVFGLKWACGLLIASAIFTTMVSSLKITSDIAISSLAQIKKLAFLGEQKNRAFMVFFCLLIAYPLSFFGFENIVDNLYPFVSVCGVTLTAIVLTYLILDMIKTSRRLRAKTLALRDGSTIIRDGDDSRSPHHRSRGDDSRNPHHSNHRPRKRRPRPASDCHGNNPQTESDGCHRPLHPSP